MIKKQAEAWIPTEWGRFNMVAFSDKDDDWMPHIAMIQEHTDINNIVNVRFHSECITGDVFHSKKCECGKQLHTAMDYLQKHGGILLYLRQEGRNIGIINKLKAYKLQEQGLNTAEANLKLGLPADGRDFNIAIDILKQLNVTKINLLTNNPDKLNAIENSNIKLEQRIAIEIKALEENQEYLETKKKYFGHLLNLE